MYNEKQVRGNEIDRVLGWRGCIINYIYFIANVYILHLCFMFSYPPHNTRTNKKKKFPSFSLVPPTHQLPHSRARDSRALGQHAWTQRATAWLGTLEPWVSTHEVSERELGRGLTSPGLARMDSASESSAGEKLKFHKKTPATNFFFFFLISLFQDGKPNASMILTNPQHYNIEKEKKNATSKV